MADLGARVQKKGKVVAAAVEPGSGQQRLSAQLAVGGRLLKLCLFSAVALAVITFTSWVLSWPLLWAGPIGNDMPYHLHLLSWVEQSWPGLQWWYPWDAEGVSYREGYPLAAHWVAALIAHTRGLSDAQSLQLMMFWTNPLCALGVFFYCAWRLDRAVMGVIAAFLYLLSPMVWDYLVNWGLFANEVGTVLFMPALIALDACFSAYERGDLGWRFRSSAIAFCGLSAALGYLAPGMVGVTLAIVPIYVLALGARTGARLSWLLLWTPLMAAVTLGLSLWWALPMWEYLHVGASRMPALAYSSSNVPVESLKTLLQLDGLDPSRVETMSSLTPAVWLPAIIGAVAAAWNGRLRVVLVLCLLGLLEVVRSPFYDVIYQLPLFNYLVTVRDGLLYLSFLLPVLAAAAFAELPRACFALGQMRLSGWARQALRPVAAVAVAVIGVSATAGDFLQFSGHVPHFPHAVGYGAWPMRDTRDLWGWHVTDTCGSVDNQQPLCADPVLNRAFSLEDVLRGCSTGSLEAWRQDVPLCRGLGTPKKLSWDPANDGLVAQTLDWCRDRISDPVCRARFLSPVQQLTDRALWRPLGVTCGVEQRCHDGARALLGEQEKVSPAPQRAALNADMADFLMRMHDLTGGGQIYSYNYQVPASPELQTFALDHMVDQPGQAELKTQLAHVLGVDVVVLFKTQAAVAKTYEQMGWQESAKGDQYVLWNPQPSGLASEWGSPATALVIGASQNTDSHPYNDVYEASVKGLLGDDQAWLVRGHSAYIDDYSEQELAQNKLLVLIGYRYHNQGNARSLLEGYVKAGGSLYIETGWQYVDPDWDMGQTPGFLPVASMHWTALKAAPAEIDGELAQGWSPFTEGSNLWGASAATGTRKGASSVVTVGDKVISAQWSYGKGKVFWSGGNLLAHALGHPDSNELAFLGEQMKWLAPKTGEQQPLQVSWQGTDQATLQLSASDGPTEVMLKQESAPGWKVQLVTPNGTQDVQWEPAEQDFLLVRLQSVPEGSRLVFRYGPTTTVYASWVLSVLALLLALAWLVHPAPLNRLVAALAGMVTGGFQERKERMLRSFTEEDPDE